MAGKTEDDADALTAGQRAVYELPRPNNGSVVAEAAIKAAGGWTDGTWAQYRRDAYYGHYLRTPSSGRGYLVRLGPSVSAEQFWRQVTRSRPRVEEGYHPYPVEVVEELELLTRQRASGSRGLTHTQREENTARIDQLFSELKSQPSPCTNDVVLGTRLIRIVGSGGYGTVWEGQDEATKDKVAVKIFNSDKLGSGTTLYHFRRGVRAMEHLADIDGQPRSIIRILNTTSALGTTTGGAVTSVRLSLAPHSARSWRMATAMLLLIPNAPSNSMIPMVAYFLAATKQKHDENPSNSRYERSN